MGYTFALQYKFSTKAQFYLILENQGYLGRDYINDGKLNKKIDDYKPDQARITQLKELFLSQKAKLDFVGSLHNHYQLDLVFHSTPGKKPYGYTVIDHATKQVFKGSEILNLKYLLDERIEFKQPDNTAVRGLTEYLDNQAITYHAEHATDPVYVGPVMIADDVDDQQVLGMKRRRQMKARSNTR